MKVQKTYNELLICEDNDLVLYATPTNQSSLTGYYWASCPNFQNDVCVATPMSFLEAAGYDSFCRDKDYLKTCGNEVYELVVADKLCEIYA